MVLGCRHVSVKAFSIHPLGDGGRGFTAGNDVKYVATCKRRIECPIG